MPAAGGSATLWVLLVPCVLVLLVLLLGLSKRVRVTLGSSVRDISRRIHAALTPVESRDDFIGAFDRLVVAVFGPESATWHNRTVEQALASRCPELRQEVHRLVSTYVIARYAPEGAAIPGVRLRESADLLRQLGSHVCSRPAAANAAA